MCFGHTVRLLLNVSWFPNPGSCGASCSQPWAGFFSLHVEKQRPLSRPRACEEPGDVSAFQPCTPAFPRSLVKAICKVGASANGVLAVRCCLDSPPPRGSFGKLTGIIDELF